MSAEPATAEQHLQRLEQTVETFARQLQEAQEAGVKPALLMPRMVAVFKRTFGEPPEGGLPALGWGAQPPAWGES